MRFDDRLATILKLPGGDASADAAAWSQLVSLLVQNGSDIGDSERELALSRLARLRPNVPLPRRKFVSASLAGKVHDREIVLHFGEDIAPVAAPVIVGAMLDESAWSAIIPKLPPTSRALLRERRDLPLAVGQLLTMYGVGDTALPPSDDSVRIHDEPAIQIRDLVARIEAYKQDRGFETLRPEAPEVASPQDRSAAFRFETDRVGILNWVEGTARGPLIGVSFAESAEPRAFGVDGQVSGAFRKRAPFRDARLRVPGASAAGGDWLVSADPCFDPEDGRFRGYRGYARRPDTRQPVGLRTDSTFGDDISADSIRQLVHELRSPLNAICGFAEMIESQIFGPVAHSYRLRARLIVEDSRRLARVVDDIDIAARLESHNETDDGRSDVLFLIEQALDRIDQKAIAAGVNFRLSAAAGAPLAAIDTSTGIDLIVRVLDEVIDTSTTGDRLPIDVRHNPQQIMISIGRGGELRPTPPPVAPVTTGPAFAQRLIARMATAAGGRFNLTAGKFTLILRHAHDSEEKTIESS